MSEEHNTSAPESKMAQQQPTVDKKRQGVEVQGETTQQDVVEAQEEGKEQASEQEIAAALQAARAQAEENYDRFLRTAAELDNYRKRTAKIRLETREEVLRDVLLQIAPILDNVSRALSQESQDFDSLKQGVELISSQFKDVLQRYGLEEIEAVGKPFDPNLHEALMEVEDQQHPAGTVVGQLEKGYTLNKKVARASRVIVSKTGA